MKLYEMGSAVEEARQTLRNADEMAARMADLIAGRLRNVPVYTLKKLKRELADFNMQTGRWKE